MKGFIITGVLSSILFLSCTTMEYSNVRVGDEKLLYRNDFSDSLDDFSFETQEGEIVEIQEETLHLNAYGREKKAIKLLLNRDFPRRAILSFRLKLFRGVTTGQYTAPRRATLFLGGTYPDHEIQIMFHPDSISFRQSRNGELLSSDDYSTLVKANVWYDVKIVFEDDFITVFLNGIAKKSFALQPLQRETNNLTFYTNKEYWIDDLEISSYGSYEYVEPE